MLKPLQDFLKAHTGRMVFCETIAGGPFKVTKARIEDGVILLTLETPDGDHEARSEQCVLAVERN